MSTENTTKMMTLPIVIAAALNHTATIIFLHGLGDTGHSWSRELEAIREPYMKIVCPNADIMPVKMEGLAEMTAWFDLEGLEPTSTEDVDGITKAALYVNSLIDEEIKAGIPPERILVGGFSQGGALALYSALTCSKKLAGIVALSCWLPLRKTLTPSMVKANKNIPILQCHGTSDDVVKFDFGKSTAGMLRKVSENVDFKKYVDVKHSLCNDMMDDIKKFMLDFLPADV